MIKKLLSGVIAISILAAAGGYYWYELTYHPSTDDAYLKTNIVNVASQVNGRIVTLNVKDDQAVKRGDLLFVIDRAPYEIALRKAQADMDYAVQQLAAANDEIKTAQAKVSEAEANLAVTEKNAARILTLVKQGRASAAEGDEVTAKLKMAQASADATRSQLQQAIATSGGEAANNPRLRAAEAQLQKAQLDLKYTQVYAPADGIISRLTSRVGDTAVMGQPLFALVEQDEWWVEANFKETQLTRVKPGQTAKITIDIYPKHTFSGKVLSISRGSGAAFAVLPTENASGNWVKVTQRFPVKVSISHDNEQTPFRVGASATVTIDTTNE